jgi:hypothetical protein
LVGVGASRRSRTTLEPHHIDHEHFTRFRKHLGAMDPNTKLILDELKSVQTNLTNRIASARSSHPSAPALSP